MTTTAPVPQQAQPTDLRTSFALGLVGEGISGSLTPAMQEAEGLAQGLNLTYRRVELDGIGVERLPRVLEWARHFGLDGFNVTHPAKQAVLPLLDDMSPLARQIGAVNTVVVGPGGRLVGHNTDALGFVRGLDHLLPGALDGRVVQVGAGGAGSAIAHAMLHRGAAHLTVFDIDATRRDTLAGKLAEHYGKDRVSATGDVAAALGQADGLVNATPIGMMGHPGTPVPLGLLRPELWVADVIYSPIDTELLLAAQHLGCRTANGGGMAVFQGVESFEIFTGRPANAERMLASFLSLLEKRGF